ncbi:hypothetical protein SISNIDRAFT_468221 [Sistotremastrum niveocremeum HHB9708]|uniref:Uncharacterized protein n=1 Tax=Sistotremastrum niveocremeum HHB9708 TaxID=1314777 RepID=A0A164RY16_9AGAM|nr:hypothetical protein SISNIDRAFT_468221 [Sistotremastrum niveocremeum HHB9708]
MPTAHSSSAKKQSKGHSTKNDASSNGPDGQQPPPSTSSTSNSTTAHAVSDDDSDNAPLVKTNDKEKRKKKKASKKKEKKVEDEYLVIREIVLSPVAASDTKSKPTSLSASGIEKLRLKHLAVTKDGNKHLLLNKSFNALQVATWVLGFFPHVEEYARRHCDIADPTPLDLITPALRRQTVVSSLPMEPEFSAEKYIQLSKNTRDGAYLMVFEVCVTIPERLRDIWQAKGPDVELGSDNELDIDAVLMSTDPLFTVLSKRKRKSSVGSVQAERFTRYRLQKRARTSKSPSPERSRSSSPTIVGTQPPSPAVIPQIAEAPPAEVIVIPDSPPLVAQQLPDALQPPPMILAPPAAGIIHPPARKSRPRIPKMVTSFNPFLG